MSAYNPIEYLQSPVPSTMDEIKLKNAIFDEIFITSDLDFDIVNENLAMEYFPDEWNNHTKLHAKFQNSIIAGGFMFDDHTDSGFLIKRRPVNEVLWTSVGYIDYHNFVFEDDWVSGVFIDRTAIPNDTYEYLIIPILFGQEHTEVFVDNSVHCYTDGIAISEIDKTYYTQMETNISSITQNQGTTMIETLNGRYPYAFKNGALNYITGSAQGLFAPSKDDCNYIFDNKKNKNIAWKYREEFRQWLCNGRPKILKYYDGRTYLVSINDKPQDDDSEYNFKNITSFSFAQIGDVNSTSELIENGLMNDY